ncbi:terminase small subunit [Bacillus canaveralius]|uniref:Terminase small subunit n=1 Tax=Bacillus canaveralius TaxID=1403243 RepID=A0A2N5GPQ0_9BACI|nr:terminase small subunit [Bacillus canaveralius]PLR84686.1 terminase small subunit [Bacillus canaveralius]PLS00833.1 terminase small subunit [Bacillus canaveralius]
MRKLTAKQQRFVEEYLIDLNASRAMKRAGYKSKNPDVDGHNLLVKPSIQQEINKAMEKRSKRTEITQDRVLQELAKVGFADIKDFLSFRTEKTIVGRDKEGNQIVDYAHVVDLKSSDEIDGTLISEIGLKDGQLKFKLHDKMRALQDIGRHLGMFTDKLEAKITVKNKLEEFFE